MKTTVFPIDRPIRVLYVDYTGAAGSAAWSLEKLIRNLPAGSVEAFLLSPPGPGLDGFRKAGVELFTIPAMMHLRSVAGVPLRGIRWLTVLPEIWRGRHGRIIRQVIRRVRPDLVHLNERGLHQAAWHAWRLGIPVVAHARSIAEHRNRLAGRVHARLAKWVHTAIAIDEGVRRSLDDYRACELIYNPLFNGPVRPQEGRKEGAGVTVGYVSGLLPHKGVLDLLAAARLLRGRKDIVFHVYGSNPRPARFYRSRFGRACTGMGLARDMESEARAFVVREHLEETVRLHGPGEPSSSRVWNMDILAFPGHTNALPRSVVDAGIRGIPSVVTTPDRIEDIVRHEVNGLVSSPGDPLELAQALVRLADDESLRRQLGENARRQYRAQFDAGAVGRMMLDLYRRVLREVEEPRPRRRNLRKG